MKIGYCCINWQLRNNNIFTGRSCVQKNFTPLLAGKLALQNVRDLLRILEWNERSGIKAFRIGNNLFPHATNPEVAYVPDDLPQGKDIREVLAACGRYAGVHGHQLTIHPPHFVSLASDAPAIRERSITELEHHRWTADSLCAGFPGLVVNLNWHVGRNCESQHIPVFLNTWRRLSEDVRRRSCLENDDSKNGWSVPRLHRYLYPETGCRISFDTHHWGFCHERGMQEEYELARSTWQGELMEVHVSNSAKPGEQSIQHSGYLYERIPEYILRDPKAYVLIEAGAKEKAVFRYAEEYGIVLNPSTALRLP